MSFRIPSAISSKKYSLLLFLILPFLLLDSIQAQTADQIIQQMAAEMGGIETLAPIQFIKSTHVGHKHWIEQSENPKGPFITSYERATEVRALQEDKIHQELSVTQFQFKQPVESVSLIAGNSGYMKFGERNYPMPTSYSGEFLEWIRYDPVTVVQKLLKSNSLQKKPDVIIDDIPHFVIDATFDESLHRLYISQDTYLISEIDFITTLPNDQFYALWGSFKTNVKFSLYNFFENGVRYPMQWDIYRRDLKWKSSTILDIDFKPEVPDSLFITDQQLFDTGSIHDKKADFSSIQEIADGVFLLPGAWFVSWIIHENEIVVIEAPISSSYSSSVIDYLSSTYPNKTISAVINASDAHPHIAGLRTYAAKNIPVYSSYRNQELIEELFEANYSKHPDVLSEVSHLPTVAPVKTKMKLNDRIEIYPVEGEGGARMLFVYLKNEKLLYAADLIQKIPNGSFFMPQYLTEVKDVIERNQLNVETVYALHTPPIPWQSVETFLMDFSSAQ
ncbi:MAG: hypothetical protein CL670_14885 [Balneola sp.]|jgi:hypothetical protein|nr:hypothetical protein [Balneola sp.]MBE80442.1 hypothetical protein [Balneola sp.]HAD51285.1 hypothetical protein [Algoriphagus sp.]|tara:strand:+ start:6458 stop:7969 length:1512 start_codon:yes stop_codon:yes gene_type:complete